MKLTAIKYYISSIWTLMFQTNFLIIPLILIKKPILFKTKSELKFYVNSLMDIWTIKEVVLDKNYHRFQNINKGDIVIDIGASIGDFSILTSKRAKKVYSFDPNTNRAKLFKKNIKINNIKNIEFEKKKIYSIEAIFQKKRLKKCDFMKIDCEGNEYKIFEKINPKILRKINYISFEIHLFNKQMKKNYEDLKKIFIKNKFTIKEIPNPVHSYILYAYCKKRI